MTELAISRNPGPVIEVGIRHAAMAARSLVPGTVLQVMPSFVSDGALVTATHTANTIVLHNIHRPGVYYVVDVLVSLDVQGPPPSPAPAAPRQERLYQMQAAPSSPSTWLQPEQPPSSSAPEQPGQEVPTSSPGNHGPGATASGQEVPNHPAVDAGLAVPNFGAGCPFCTQRGARRRAARAWGVNPEAPTDINVRRFPGGPPPPPPLPLPGAV